MASKAVKLIVAVALLYLIFGFVRLGTHGGAWGAVAHSDADSWYELPLEFIALIGQLLSIVAQLLLRIASSVQQLPPELYPFIGGIIVLGLVILSFGLRYIAIEKWLLEVLRQIKRRK